MKFFAFSQCFRQDIATLPQRARRRIYGLRAVSSKQYLAENNFFDSLAAANSFAAVFLIPVSVIEKHCNSRAAYQNIAEDTK